MIKKDVERVAAAVHSSMRYLQSIIFYSLIVCCINATRRAAAADSGHYYI